MRKMQWVVDVQENENGEAFIEFTDEMLEDSGIGKGDTVEWIDNGDGSWTLKKKETEYVLVETVSMFRQRYVVEVPKGKSEWALDTVTCEQAKEFSQKHLDEVITSHRTMTRNEVLSLCDQDNEYCTSWDEDTKFQQLVTRMEDYQ